MRVYPLFWAIYFLAVIAGNASDLPLTPVFSRISLPAALDNKPIWVASRLKDGALAVGYEGGFAIGTPNGQWTSHESPNGQVVKVIEQSTLGILVAGEGFCGYLGRDGLVLDPAMSGDYVSAAATSDGWLVAGRDVIWHIKQTVSQRWTSKQTVITGEVRLVRREGKLIASSRTGPVFTWTEEGFRPYPELSALSEHEIGWSDRDIFATDRGIVSASGKSPLDATANRRELRAGIVGVAKSGPNILVATFSEGISIYLQELGTLRKKWKPDFGNVYFFNRDGQGFLMGTSKGVFAFADPNELESATITNEPILELLAGDGSGAIVITSSGALSLTQTTVVKERYLWPQVTTGALIEKGVLQFRNNSYELPARFVYGFSALKSTTALITDRELKIYQDARAGEAIRLEGILSSLATDGRNYLVSTTTRGVHIVSPQGRVVGRIGTGRAHVSEVRPGKVALLFWDGTILDSDSNLLGRVTAGNPRDAALVDGRLAVLVTRTDRDPIIGIVENDQWLPVEIPGLAQIGAEQIAANEEFLFAAGPRGVIRVRLPLKAAAPPSPVWKWSGTVIGTNVTLSNSSEEFVELSPSLQDLPPASSTRFKIRINDGKLSDVQPGRPLQVPVSWGRTEIATLAERNGLVAEETFTVFRPWPWWARPWAWPLHVGACAGLVFALARLKMHRLERKNHELERRVALRTAELRKANAAKEEFLAGISHEIRNPLNGVVGICAMLADREVGPREKMLVRTLGGCADQLRSMLDDILDFSRIERGDVSVSEQDFELSSLIEESAMVMDPERSACTLILPDGPVWLHGDSGKLRQIACNLISNALKYGVPREAGIEVRVENAGGGRSRVRIAVRNTGPTIPAEEIPRLFDSFQRGSRTAGIPGSGLGLAVCRRLIRAMGGRITAASVDGVTEFAIEVRLANARPPSGATELPAMVSRALAIEDEDYNRIALGHVLRALGYNVDWAADGASAIKLASERQYDLVLTDWRLPDMDGGHLCRRILALLPNPKPPVIAVTAYSTAEKLEEAKLAGMTGFVTKPITKEKLARVIRGLSEGLQPRRSLDINLAPPLPSPLASLGDLAPSCEELASSIAAKWRSTTTLAELRDPRTPREAHALRSLLLLASESETAEQVSLIESAAEASDWTTVDRLLPFAAEEIAKTRQRLSV